MPLHRPIVLLLAVTATACTRVGAPTPAPAPAEAPAPVGPVERSFSGMTTLGGQRLRVTLDMATQPDGRGTAHLQIPALSLDAQGSVTWKGYAVELELTYDGGCPGQVRIRAQAAGEGAPLEGTLSARDCTGEEAGTVVLEATAGPDARAVRGPSRVGRAAPGA